MEVQAKLGSWTNKDICDKGVAVIINIGYVLMFVCSCPIVAAIAWVTLSFHARIFAWELMTVYKRPRPRVQCGLGAWNGVVKTMSIIGIMISVLVLVFNLELLNVLGFNFFDKCLFAFFAEHVCLAVMLAGKSVQSETPTRVKLTTIRRKLIADRVLIGNDGPLATNFEDHTQEVNKYRPPSRLDEHHSDWQKVDHTKQVYGANPVMQWGLGFPTSPQNLDAVEA